MDSFFGHCEIPSKQLLALALSQGWAVLIHPLSVETSKAAIAGGPISGGTDVGLSTLWPAFAKLDNGDPTVARSPVPRLSIYEGAV